MTAQVIDTSPLKAITADLRLPALLVWTNLSASFLQ
jgi:hypothetical protein